MSSNLLQRHPSEDVDMSEEPEDAEMPEQPEEKVASDYNYLNDESAIRGGADGGVTPPFSDEKNVKRASPEDEEFPEDDVDPIVYMGLVNQKK